MSVMIGDTVCQFCFGRLAHRNGLEVCSQCGKPYEKRPPTSEPLPKCRVCGGKVQFKGGIQRCVDDACGEPLHPGADSKPKARKSKKEPTAA